ncbi:MAG: DNA-3-methyladenine glycosylase family protein [Actinomycetota bacterium]
MSPPARAWRTEIPLAGAGGEPVDLRRTLVSHGLVSLPPMVLDEDIPALDATLRVGRGRPRTIRISPGRDHKAAVTVAGPAPGRAVQSAVVDRTRHLLRLDEDLSSFYAQIADDPDLAWAARGAGRLVRGGSVFEDVIKTICTTNCTWSATVRMVGAIVEHLGEPAAGNAGARAFPSPQAMTDAGADFYRDVARAGYRGPYLAEVARRTAAGEIDLEIFDAGHPSAPSDEQVSADLLALPGIGPYALAHIMMMLGRYSNLVLDSWTRPTYARLAGRKSVADVTIERRFRKYGEYAGLAFWLYLTRPWVEESHAPPA